MSSYHKPRTFRSLHGCCICRAKSSSSRFTDSKKYEEDFEACFQVLDERSGDICNACVLLVKRWKKLPRGSKKNWNHVVDARAGPGTKTYFKQKARSQKDDPDVGRFKKITAKHLHRSASYQPPSPTDDNTYKGTCSSPTPSDVSEHSISSYSAVASADVSPFLDLSYWKRTDICCGTVFKGLEGEVMIDAKLYKPCSSHMVPGEKSSSIGARSRTDTNSSSSSFAALQNVSIDLQEHTLDSSCKPNLRP